MGKFFFKKNFYGIKSLEAHGFPLMIRILNFFMLRQLHVEEKKYNLVLKRSTRFVCFDQDVLRLEAMTFFKSLYGDETSVHTLFLPKGQL